MQHSYTDEGNFGRFECRNQMNGKLTRSDIVGNNVPVFFIQDAIQFPDLIHSGMS